jgi:hypothetical protein
MGKEQCFSRKMAHCYEEVAYKRIINCANAVELRNAGKYMYKIRRERKNKEALGITNSPTFPTQGIYLKYLNLI